IGQIGNFGQANYAASKAGVAAFTKSLAKELAGKGVTVNAVAPGFIETEMVANIPDKVKDRLLAQIPLHRFGTAEEVARAVVYIARPAPAATLPSHTDPRKVAELLDAIQTLSRELDLSRLLQIIMDKASRLLKADRSSLFVADEERGELWSKIAQGLEVRE